MNTPLFLGGLEQYNLSKFKFPSAERSFRGCMRNVRVRRGNDDVELLDMLSPLKNRSVATGCPAMDACKEAAPCGSDSNAVCYPVWNGKNCGICRLGYKGDQCKLSKDLFDYYYRISSRLFFVSLAQDGFTFSGNGYVEYAPLNVATFDPSFATRRLRREVESADIYEDQLQIRLRTRGEDRMTVVSITGLDNQFETLEVRCC